MIPGRGGRGRKRARGSSVAAYVICTTWLEDSYPKKLWLCDKWELVKLLSGGKPVPEKLSHITYGIDLFSPETAVAKALEVLWDTSHYKKKLSTDDVFVVTDDFVRAHAAGIDAARSAHEAEAVAGSSADTPTNVIQNPPADPEVAGPSGPPLADLEMAGAAPPAAASPTHTGLGVLGIDDDGRAGLHSPLETINESEAEGGEVNEDQGPNQKDTSGDIDVSLQLQQLSAICDQLGSAVSRLDRRIDALDGVSSGRVGIVHEVMAVVFDLRCVGLYNFVMKDRETDAAYAERVKRLLYELGFRSESAAVHLVKRRSKFTTMVAWTDARHAQSVLDGSPRFRPDHWLRGPDQNPAVSSVLIQLKDACLAVRSGSDRVAGGGFVHVTRWQKNGSAPHTDRTQPQAPGRGRAPTNLEQRLL